MNKLKSLPLGIALLVPSFAFSQVSITNSDMPDPGDSIRVSYAASLGSFDHTLSDSNYVWDVSFLTANAQERIEFISPTAFPFNLLSDIAVTNYSPDSLPIIGEIPTNFTDYYKSSNSSFRQVGLSFDFPQVIPISAPIIFSSADYVYRFPVDYGDIDSCDASYGFAIPGIGYIGQDRHRVNVVDGWGTLITPTDTFQVVRMRTVLDITDTISMDTSNQTGFAIPRPTEVQYKWLAPGMKIPVLEVDCQILFNAEVVTNIIYQDTMQAVWQVSVSDQDLNTPLVSVYPNPANETVYVQYSQNGQGDVVFQLNDLTGNSVWNTTVQNANTVGIQVIDVSSLPAGIYLISVITESGKTVSKIVIQ